MATTVRSDRRAQIVAWAVASVFILGFFLSPIGVFTGPIMDTWFVGTQRLRRGFVWAVAINLVTSLLFDWRMIPLAGAVPAVEYLGWLLLATALGVLPFTLHRLVSPRMPGFLATLPLPLAAAGVHWLGLELHVKAASALGSKALLFLWFAAVVVWLWNRESRATVYVFGTGVTVLVGLNLMRPFFASAIPNMTLSAVGPACLSLFLLLAIWALFRPIQQTSWVKRRSAVARLRSPFTREQLRVASEHGREALVSASGERFPVRNGIPAFLKPEDLTGDNGKYNHLYDLIGGFYNDIQRVFSPLRGFDLDDYFRSYMRLLDVKPGDAVLETSVGTGLNFRYLPSDVKLSGLDLSPEMLANCQVNLRRWKIDADLYLCNAESLPFADSSFDVVFHVGGINFFNDRAKAIREMIRVAKPGSLILIADETEKHVKEVYEKSLGNYFKNRKEEVSAPIDLVPAEMEDVRLESLKGGMFYALTFRKPARGIAVESDASADVEVDRELVTA
jgi:ubiquinone/menaquinone biosynthesis C-methylase UbiE